MTERKAEDRLREEYFALLPSIRRTAEEIEAEVRFRLIALARDLASHERLVVRTRVKECESAIAALRRRQEMYKLERSETALKSLNDLAGVRVLAFPRRRLLQADELLRARFAHWTPDPVPPVDGCNEVLALKYHGFCSDRSEVRGELQIVPMLIGLFWEVEHGALYKPGPGLLGIEHSLQMRNRNADVIRALHAFDAEFEEMTGSRRRATARTNA